jgi:hemoglobin
MLPYTEVTSENIKELINSFYEAIQADDLMGHYFNQEAQINWEHHLPRMYAFWESMILGAGTYTGSLMGAHWNMHQKAPMEQEHFDRWLMHFHNALNKFYIPELAEDIKLRSMAMGANIRMKLRKG